MNGSLFFVIDVDLKIDMFYDYKMFWFLFHIPKIQKIKFRKL